MRTPLCLWIPSQCGKELHPRLILGCIVFRYTALHSARSQIRSCVGICQRSLLQHCPSLPWFPVVGVTILLRQQCHIENTPGLVSFTNCYRDSNGKLVPSPRAGEALPTIRSLDANYISEVTLSCSKNYIFKKYNTNYFTHYF